MTFPFPQFAPLAKAPVVTTYHTAVTDGSGSSPWSEPGLSIGSAYTTRRVFVAIAAPSTGTALNPAVSGVTIGGVTGILYGARRHSSNTFHEVSFWYADVSTGTTATVVITGASGHNRSSMTVAGVWSLDNSLLLNNQPTDSAFDSTASGSPLSASVTVQAGGFVLAVVCRQSSSGTYTWGAITERYDVDAGNQIVSSASDNFTTGGTVAVTSTPSGTSVTQILYAVAGR